MLDENEALTMLNVTPEEYEYIEKLRNDDKVFTAVITEEIKDSYYSYECELIIQKETLKIIKYDSVNSQWKGNSFIFFKSVDFTSTLITESKNYLTLNIKGSKFLFEFSDSGEMFDCYKELTRKTNMQYQRKFL